MEFELWTLPADEMVTSLKQALELCKPDSLALGWSAAN
jgi:hypothetical protein